MKTATFKTVSIYSLLLVVVGFVTACGGNKATLNIPDRPRPSEAPSVTAESRMRVADRLFEGGNYQSAYQLYRRAHEENPKQAEPLIGMGRVLLRLGSFEAANDNFAQALILDADNVTARQGRAESLLMMGQPGQALIIQNRLVEEGVSNPRLSNSMAMAYDLMGQHAEAQRHYAQAISETGEDARYKNNLALSFALSGDYETAIGLMKDLVQNANATPATRQNLALIYGLAGQDEFARQIGMVDLAENEVDANIAFYQQLRKMPSIQQAAIIMLGSTQ